MDTVGVPVTAQAPDFPANMNMLVFPSGGLGLDELETLNLAQVKQLAYRHKLNHGRVALPAGEALYFSYRIKLGSLGLIGEIQYLLVSGDKQYVLSVTGLASDPTLADVAKGMADTFEILP